MFTGIIETLGKIEKIEPQKENLLFTVQSPISSELKIDQSLSHNGVCLTVIEVEEDRHKVVAIRETLDKSNLGMLQQGDWVNLERCMKADGRFDGHIVQGHVDLVAECVGIEDEAGSFKLSFEYENASYITVEKGSITLNGISLTVVDSKPNSFSVAIIPYTWEHTNLHQLKIGSTVNLEFDIVGKYIQKMMENRG